MNTHQQPQSTKNNSIEKPVVLVTGGAGLIGSRLAKKLRDDFQPVALDLAEPKSDFPALWIRCDLTSNEGVSAALDQVERDFGTRLASVVHLAAYYDFSGEPSPLYDELTVEGTRRLLWRLQRFETEQFIFSSTLLVMKPAEEHELLTSYSPTDAEWDYPQSKLRAERVIMEERGGIPAVVLRIAGVYDEEGHSVPIAQQISRIHQRQFESYFFPGNKEHGQAFVHLDDTIACIRAAIDRRDQLLPHEVLLIGEEEVMSYAELQEEIGRLLHGKEWPTYCIPKTVAKVGAWVKDKFAGDEDQPFIKPWMIDLADQHYPISGQQAREKLGWQPQHSLRETLPAMIENLKRDPQVWYKANKIPYPGESAYTDEPQETGAHR